MAPNNWEEQIKQGLQGREIQPSAQAWDRLDAMLTVAEEKKTKRPFGVYFRYMAIAASVLVLLSLGIYFASNLPAPDANIPTGVTQKEGSNAVTIPTDTVPADLPVDTRPPTEAVAVQPTKTQPNGMNSKSTAPQHNKRSINQYTIPTTESYAATAVPAPQTVVPNPLVNSQTIAGVTKTAVAVAPPQLAKTTIKVDATSLLNQVDGELNQSFRERMFDRLNRNYQSAKSALATRNQE
ncbi:hypothetical protein [Flavobacterium sp.]|uniref:hypothetical protein n=1 Tax=Flavobacterium sp. TaxID=239 RepID=UPI0026234270|nr:hypothetical protein [Flavobacterium sp.]